MDREKTTASPTPITRDELRETQARRAERKPPASAALAWLVAAAALAAILIYVYL